jgi:NADPH:quinone reductase-like Zn-dependent oxidoreductase
MGLSEKTAAFEAIRQKMLGHIANGDIKPVIHGQFPLKDAMAAHQAMQAGAHVGKLVLDCKV